MHENLAAPHTLTSLKAVLLGIKSHDVIEYVSPYISETLGPSLRKKLRRKHASESMFEVYFIILELFDTLAVELYSSKLVKKAIKCCQESTAIFAVPSFPYGQLIVVTMYFTTERG